MALESSLTLTIRTAGRDDVDAVVVLTLALFDEIGHSMNESAAQRVACNLIGGAPRYQAILAFPSELKDPAGVLTLAESHSIYAGGQFGSLQEFYVKPAFRSIGIGRRLLSHAQKIGRSLGWHRLEVTAPIDRQFLRSVAFYRAMGFEDSGPRMLLELRSCGAEQIGD